MFEHNRVIERTPVTLVYAIAWRHNYVIVTVFEVYRKKNAIKQIFTKCLF